MTHAEARCHPRGVDHVSNHVLRALWYIDAMTAQGVVLDHSDVDRIATEPPPRDVVYQSWLSSIRSNLLPEVAATSAEPVAEYLIKVRWAREIGGFELTDLGRAVLQMSGAKQAAQKAQDPVVSDLALHPEDPLVYTVLTRRLAAAGAGLLVDPYFKAENLRWILESTSVRRILISKKASTKERPIIAVALGTLPNGQSIEVRATTEEELHDRRIIAVDGTVQLIGTSINGVGRHQTALVSPEPAIAKVYREESEKLWAAAEKVQPQQLKNPIVAPTAQQAP